MRLKNSDRTIYLIDIALLVALAIYTQLGSVEQIFRAHFLILSIGLLLIISLYIFGYKKDKHYLKASASRIVIAGLLIAGIISYTLGIFLNFTKSYFSTSLEVMPFSMFPAAIAAAEVEVLRYVLFRNYTRGRGPLVFFTILTIFLDVAVAFRFSAVDTPERIFVFVSSIVFPAIAEESLCSYLTYHVGLLPSLIFKMTITLYAFVLPIVPNLGPYLYAVINIVMPFVIYEAVSRIDLFYDRDRKRFRHISISIFTIPLIAFLLFLTILISGIFNYKLIAIGSDSMRPTYARGDAIIFEKAKAKDIKKGDILVFRNNGITITHRVTNITTKDDVLYFTTKGDANAHEDAFTTSSDQVDGKVVLVSKYIGFPTLWINNIFNGE